MTVVGSCSTHTVRPCRPGSWLFLAVAVALLVLPAVGSAQAEALQGAAKQGRNLFVGNTRFQNGGPPCVVCHSTAGIGFPNGGTLGPNLTGLYNKLGPIGAKAVFQTLFFPTMVPIYSKRPLVPTEQADLLAFFQATANVRQPHETSGLVFLIAIVGAIVFLILTGFFWRKRVLGVRARMVERTTKALRARRQGVQS